MVLRILLVIEILILMYMKIFFACSILYFSAIVVSFSQVTQKINIVVPKVAKIKLVSNSNLDFSVDLTPPNTAGEEISVPTLTGNKSYLNISSVVAQGSANERTVTVHSDVNLSVGTVLSVTTGPVEGVSVGKSGTHKGKRNINTVSKTIIDQIGSSYTGVGVGNGFPITYDVTVATGNDYGTIYSGSRDINVIYTLSGN